MKLLKCNSIWQVIWKPIVVFLVVAIITLGYAIVTGQNTAGKGVIAIEAGGLVFVYCFFSYIYHLLKR